jgi:hypothetical protein
MKHLVGKTVTQKVPFMENEVEIRKLSVKEVLSIQEMVKKAAKVKNPSDDHQLDLLREILRMAVVGAAEMTNEEFDTFPLGELTTVSETVMSFSGLTDPTAGN